MTRAEELRALAEQVEALERPDWAVDDLINNAIGTVRRVAVLGLRGMGSRERYFGPRANPNGKGSAVPKPTKTPQSRAKAAAILRALAEDEGKSDG